jgi:hypothetical protein
MGLAHGVNIVNDGLVFYADPMNPRSWTGPDSSTVNNLKGSITGSIANNTSGSFGENNSFTFDGTDDIIDTGFVPKNNITSIFTFSAWVKKTSTTDSMVFGTNDYQAPNYGLFNFGVTRISSTYYYYYALGGRLISNAHMVTSYTAYSINDFSLNTWHHLVFTYDGTNVKLYDNGTLEHTGPSVTIDSYPPNTAGFNGNSYIGGTNDSRVGHSSQEFTGEIGPTQIYTRALSSNEVLHNYNALKGRFGL